MVEKEQMTTYRIDYSFEDYYSFLISNAELGSKMPNYSPKFRAKPRLAEWVRPDATFYASTNYASETIRIPDITTWLTGNLVLNRKAYDVLSERLADCGEFLPVSVEGMEYYVFNTLKVIDDKAVNREQAKEVIDAGVNVGLDNVTFDETQLAGCMVFKTTIDHMLNSYCTEEFRQIISEKGLQGLVFHEMKIK